MKQKVTAQLGGRPVFIADYRSPATRKPSPPEDSEARVMSPNMKKIGIRYNFPAAGEKYEGGTSDGYCYQITFSTGKLDNTYALVKAFLQEQGYGQVPVPQNASDLKCFRLPPKLRHQLSLFGEDGYVHNPIKILF
ncbi:MAG: hypothetical protein AAGA62_18475, partial [Bacteroidota bacterium]